MKKKDLFKIAIKSLNLKSRKTYGNWGDNILVTCPFHKDDTPSLSISFILGIYNCFGCGKSGTINSLYKELTGKSIFSLCKEYGENLEDNLFDSFHSFYQNFNQKENYEKSFDYLYIPDINNIPGIKNFYESQDALTYLKDRGIKFEIAEKYNFKYAENCKIAVLNKNTNEVFETTFYKRLLIPIYEKEKLICIEGRDVTKKQKAKVLYPKNSSKNTIFDFHNLKKDEPLYITEGLMDLFVLKEDDFFKNSTTIFGANISDRQLYLLNQFNNDIIYIPDNDEPGYNAAYKLYSELKNKKLKILEIPFKNILKDIGDLPMKMKKTISSVRKRGWGKSIDAEIYFSEFKRSYQY